MLRDSQLAARVAHFVLEQVAQRFDNLFEVHIVRQTAYVMVALDDRGFTAQAAFHHIRVDCSLYQKIHCSDFFRFLFKYADELFADDLSFLLRFLHARQLVIKTLPRVYTHKVQIVRSLRAEHRAHFLTFIFSHEAVIHEHTGKLLAHSFCQHDGHNRRIHAARKCTQHAPVSDFFPQHANGLFHERIHFPIARTAAHIINEIREHLCTLLRVQDLGMKLQRIQTLFRLLHRRGRAICTVCRDNKARSNRFDIIRVAHPAYCAG